MPPTEGICTWQCAYYLYKKGYDLFLAEAFEMATNWVMFLNAPDGNYLAELELMNSAKIKQLIRGMTEGDSVIKGPGKIMSTILGLIYICFLLFARRWLGKTFTVTRECNGCGICAKNCPGRTIKMKYGKPYWDFSCQQCFKCINTCPKQAIQNSALNFWGILLLQFTGGSILFWLGFKILGPLKGIFEMAFAIGITFPFVWLVHLLEFHPKTARFMPPWYLNRNKRRYKHRDLSLK